MRVVIAGSDSHRQYVWPELIRSRQTGGEADFDRFYARFRDESYEGLREAIQLYGGSKLQVRRIVVLYAGVYAPKPGQQDVPIVPSAPKSVDLKHRPNVLVRDENGQERNIHLIGGILEHDGVCKVATYHIRSEQKARCTVRARPGGRAAGEGARPTCPNSTNDNVLMNNFPQFNLDGQVALVTGAARGLGRAISLALAHAGADVALGLRDLNAHGGLPQEIESLGRRALALQMDVTHLDQIRRAVDNSAAHFGRLDILVNNAGVAPENLAENVREEDFDLTLQVNLKGTFFASQAAGRVMIRQNGGRIINMGSQAGFVALPTESVYCMTKAAISHLTKCLAVEWGKHNITVNAVAPTFIFTPGTEPALADPAFRADVEERIAALHRIGEPMDVAGAVVFLASPAASLITGHTMMIDGGWTAR